MCIFMQIMCDADMRVINCIAKWPGSVHDARILRESPIFAAFESRQKPLSGYILGDSGYMQRDWLMTPVPVVRSAKEEAYNTAHCGTRCTVERCIGVIKRRWHCLHGEIRMSPSRVCQIVCACIVLHNRATEVRLNQQGDADGDDDDDDCDDSDCQEQNDVIYNTVSVSKTEQARSAVGKAARDRLIQNIF